MGRRKMYDAHFQFAVDSPLQAQIAAAAALHGVPVAEFCRQVLSRFCAAQQSLAALVSFAATDGLDAMLHKGAMEVARRALARSPAASQPAAGAIG